ncbi:MAG: DUF1848 domain-containing protein [Sedimentisphaerales bacterium]|nr:DUF1848 domain-containing protein [Sedimentisphaerales bacterium]
MKKIISVSRRTDIPAFYGDWFMGRLKNGFAGAVNPFSGQKCIVSLRPQDVICFVFWSKDFSPFLENLKIIDSSGYRFYLNYTITALPDIFESNVDKHRAIKTLKQISRIFSPRHINWRFDPIVISNVSDGDFYIKSFKELASEFSGFVERCYFSFVTEYEKVRRNFAELEKISNVKTIKVSDNFKVDLANELADIAERFGIEVFSCCGDYLVNEKIKKAHCVDGSIIEQLFYPDGLSYSDKPTRDQCGCTESTDIGSYDSCPHGCVYCYANANKQKALETFNNHDKASAFLGYSKSQSDRWLADTCGVVSAPPLGVPKRSLDPDVVSEINHSKTQKACKQLEMF